MSDDRKYRQRGYQDEPKPRGPKGPAAPRPPQERAPGRQFQDAAGPKTPNLMAAHEVCRCARCGNLLALPIADDSACPKCGVIPGPEDLEMATRPGRGALRDDPVAVALREPHRLLEPVEA